MSVPAPLPPRAGVLADDLTGALDAGLQAWRRGARVRVLVEGGAHDEAGFPAIRGGADVVVLDTESRSEKPAECRARVAAALEALRAASCPLRYKKVDSTLRGNLGVELDVVLDAGAAASVLLAPSLPSAGRAVRGGILSVRGVPLAGTEAARDPLWPMARSDVAGIVAAQSALRTGILALALVRGPARGLLAAVERAEAAGARVLVADAETDDDLRALAAACGLRGERLLACGSAGLFAHLDLGLPGASVRPPEATPRRRAAGAVLVVSGSMSGVAREQIDVAVREHAAELVRLRAPALFGPPGAARGEVDRIAGAVERAVARGTTTVLDGASMSREELYDSCGADEEERARRARLTLDALSAAFGRVASAIGGLVVAGGDTAVAICRRAGADGIDLAGEVEAVVPVGVLVGGDLAGLPVVTKAGALGSPAALARAVSALGGGRTA